MPELPPPPLYVWSGRKFLHNNNRRSHLVHYLKDRQIAATGRKVHVAMCGAVLTGRTVEVSWSTQLKGIRMVPEPFHICPSCKLKGRRDRQ